MLFTADVSHFPPLYSFHLFAEISYLFMNIIYLFH